MDRKVINLAAFGGLVAESMTRGQGWRFLDMGRRLERSLQLIRLLTAPRHRRPRGAAPGSPAGDRRQLDDLSPALHERLQTAPVLDLLLADEANPRSLVFQLAALAEDVDRLPRDPAQPGRSLNSAWSLAR